MSTHLRRTLTSGVYSYKPDSTLMVRELSWQPALRQCRERDALSGAGHGDLGALVVRRQEQGDLAGAPGRDRPSLDHATVAGCRDDRDRGLAGRCSQRDGVAAATGRRRDGT